MSRETAERQIAKKRIVREHIFKLVFLEEFHEGEELNRQEDLYLEEAKRREEPGSGQTDSGEEGAAAELSETDYRYIHSKYRAIRENLPQIDRILGEKSTGWRVDRIGKAELAILRLAVYEILYDDEIPVGVAINEAVELAKSYGGDGASAFVNAVLAKLA